MPDNSQDLIIAQRDLDPVNTFILNKFFRRAHYATGKEIKLSKIKTERRMAPFVSPVVEGKVQPQKGGVVDTVIPPYLKPKDMIDPEHVSTLDADELPGMQKSMEQRADESKVDLLDSQKRRILTRTENMAVRLMLDGKYIAKGEDHPEIEVNLNRKPELTMVKTGAGVWTDETADPISDLNEVISNFKAPVTDLVFNNKGYSVFVAHLKVKDVINTDFAGSKGALERGINNAEEVQYKGHLNGIDVWVYTAGYEDEAENEYTHIADNECLIASAGCDGIRAYGAIMDPNARYQSIDIFPSNWIQNDPPGEWVMSQSAPCPLVGKINGTGKIEFM